MLIVLGPPGMRPSGIIKALFTIFPDKDSGFGVLVGGGGSFSGRNETRPCDRAGSASSDLREGRSLEWGALAGAR